MKGFTKDDIEFHNDGGIGGPYYPAVNVKVYNFGPSLSAVEDRFGYSEETAQEALNIAWDSAVDTFWNSYGAQDIAEEYFPSCKVYSAGRSGGWLIVTGLDDASAWDGVMLNRWALFARAVRAEVDYRASTDSILEDIAANEWAHDKQALEGAISSALD